MDKRLFSIGRLCCLRPLHREILHIQKIPNLPDFSHYLWSSFGGEDQRLSQIVSGLELIKMEHRTQYKSTSYNMKFNHQIGALLVLAGIVGISITTEHSPT